MKLFVQLACGWQELGNEQSMLRIRADPQPAHCGTGGLLCAWCMVRDACRVYVLQVQRTIALLACPSTVSWYY